MTTTNGNGIATRAILASLHISVWAAQRFDRQSSDEVTERKQADRSSGRFNKHLFGTKRRGRQLAPEFFAALDAADAMRDEHNRQTLPWGKRDGERLLPVANYMAYTEAMRKAGQKFHRAVDAFVNAYPRLMLQAETRLGKLYRYEDFLKPAEVRRRFGYELTFDPLPLGRGDLRVDLPADHVVAIEADVKARLEAATQEAMRDAWRRLHESVARIKDRAADPGSSIRGNLVSQVSELVDVLARLNVTGDPGLEAMRQSVARELATVDLESLKSNKAYRADTAERAARILRDMSPFYTPQKREEVKV